MWEGLLIFEFRGFEEESEFGLEFGGLLGLVFGGFWASKNGLERKKRFFRHFLGCLKRHRFLMHLERWKNGSD